MNLQNSAAPPAAAPPAVPDPAPEPVLEPVPEPAPAAPQPWDFFVAWCDALRVDYRTVPEREKGRSLREAKAILQAGYSPDDVLHCTRYMTLETWRQTPPSLHQVGAFLPRWLAMGRPSMPAEYEARKRDALRQAGVPLSSADWRVRELERRYGMSADEAVRGYIRDILKLDPDELDREAAEYEARERAEGGR